MTNEELAGVDELVGRLGIGDLAAIPEAADTIQSLAAQLAEAREENERLRGALGLIIENESADTGYGNSSAKIALAALGDWKSGAGDLGGDHVR